MRRAALPNGTQLIAAIRGGGGKVTVTVLAPDGRSASGDPLPDLTRPDMPALMPPLPVLTPNDAADALQANGLDALGLVVPTLSSGWSTVAPGAGDYNAAALRLTLNNPRAPFRGPLHYEATPTRWSDVQGQPVGGPVAVLALHPEAARRLSRLVEWRYGTPLIGPVPVAMVVHAVTLPRPRRPSTGSRRARPSASPARSPSRSTTCGGCPSIRSPSPRSSPT
jgi:hypothetical protein